MFNFLKNLNQANEPLVEKIAGEAITKGEVLDYNASGKLVKATTAAKVVAMKDAVADEKINVAPIRNEDVYETEVVSGITEGTAYDLDANSTGLATTTTNKIFLAEKVGEEKITGRFIRPVIVEKVSE